MEEQKWSLYFPKDSYTKDEVELAYDSDKRPQGLGGEVSFNGHTLTIKGPNISEQAPINTTSLVFYPGSKYSGQTYKIKINGKKIPFSLDDDSTLNEYDWYKLMKQYGMKFDYSQALIRIVLLVGLVASVVFVYEVYLK